MKDLMSRTMKDLATTPKWHLESRLKENLSEWIYLIQEVLENRGKYSKDSKSAKVHEILDEFEKMAIKLLPNNNIVGNSLCRPYDLAGGLMYGGDRMKKIIEESGRCSKTKIRDRIRKSLCSNRCSWRDLLSEGLFFLD